MKKKYILSIVFLIVGIIMIVIALTYTQNKKTRKDDNSFQQNVQTAKELLISEAKIQEKSIQFIEIDENGNYVFKADDIHFYVNLKEKTYTISAEHSFLGID